MASKNHEKGTASRTAMISSLSRFESVDESSISAIREEVDYLLDTLEVLRATNEISNDAFLESGSIQGGLTLILNLLAQGIPDEANSQLIRLKQRANSIHESFPELDGKVEGRR